MTTDRYQMYENKWKMFYITIDKCLNISMAIIRIRKLLKDSQCSCEKGQKYKHRSTKYYRSIKLNT